MSEGQWERNPNGLSYRLERLEKRLDAFQPAVMEQRLGDLDDDLKELKDRITWMTRTLLGAMVTMLGTLAVVLLLVPHGP